MLFQLGILIELRAAAPGGHCGHPDSYNRKVNEYLEKAKQSEYSALFNNIVIPRSQSDYKELESMAEDFAIKHDHYCFLVLQLVTVKILPSGKFILQEKLTQISDPGRNLRE